MTWIEDLVDGGLQTAPDGRIGVRPEFCCRDHGPAGVHSAPGSGFCCDCFAYLSGEIDDDPLADRKARQVEFERPMAESTRHIDLLEGGAL